MILDEKMQDPKNECGDDEWLDEDYAICDSVMSFQKFLERLTTVPELAFKLFPVALGGKPWWMAAVDSDNIGFSILFLYSRQGIKGNFFGEYELLGVGGGRTLSRAFIHKNHLLLKYKMIVLL